MTGSGLGEIGVPSGREQGTRVVLQLSLGKWFSANKSYAFRPDDHFVRSTGIGGGREGSVSCLM